MPKMDWADNEANRLFDMVRDAEPDEDVISAIAEALREAALPDLARPCEVGMPEAGERVMFCIRIAETSPVCFTRRVWCIGEWDQERGYWLDEDTDPYNDRLRWAPGEVTHWRPLPPLATGDD